MKQTAYVLLLAIFALAGCGTQERDAAIADSAATIRAACATLPPEYAMQQMAIDENAKAIQKAVGVKP